MELEKSYFERAGRFCPSRCERGGPTVKKARYLPLLLGSLLLTALLGCKEESPRLSLNILPGNVTMEVGETRTLPFEVQSPVYLFRQELPREEHRCGPCSLRYVRRTHRRSPLRGGGDRHSGSCVPGEQSLGQRRYPGCPPIRRGLNTPNRAETPRAREWALGVFTGQLSHRQKRQIFLSSEGGSSPRPCAPAKTTRPIRLIPAV